MSRSIIRRATNRFLHIVARYCPGALAIRPMIHRWRGVKIHGEVWIGDDVYLENDHPELVEIHEHVVLSLKCVVLAHTKGTGRVVFEKNSFIGPMAMVACIGGKTLTIGEGAVVSAGAIVNTSVPPHVVIGRPKAPPIGMSRVPWYGSTYDEFMGGLGPLRRPTRPQSPPPPPPPNPPK